jgi:hypothetical protein
VTSIDSYSVHYGESPPLPPAPDSRELALRDAERQWHEVEARRREEIAIAVLRQDCVRWVTLMRDGVPELPVGLRRR